MRFGLEFGSYPADLDPACGLSANCSSGRRSPTKTISRAVRRAALSHRPGCGDLAIDSFAVLSRRTGSGHVPGHIDLSFTAASSGDGGGIYLHAGQSFRRQSSLRCGPGLPRQRIQFVWHRQTGAPRPAGRRVGGDSQALDGGGRHISWGLFPSRQGDCLPKPLQRPGPPILLGADYVRTVAKVPEVADHWIASRRHSKTFLREALPAYKAALERQGKPFEGLLFFAIFVSPIPRAKRRNASRKATSGAISATSNGANPASATIWLRRVEARRLILGSPAEVVEQVMAYHEEFGTEVMWFMVDWPGMDPRFTLETIQRFGEEVIPQIKRLTPSCPLP